MATVNAALPALSGDLSLFHTTDPLLANAPVIILHGPAATIGATGSRIQVHVFTPAGQASYARLAVSPNSPFYSAVSNLPREEQGDEVCRGVAFGLKRYFDELPDSVKKAWSAHAKSASPQALFRDNHVAILASRMTKIENVSQVIDDITRAFAEQKLPWIDVDVVLPPGVIKDPPTRTDFVGAEELDESQALSIRFGPYAGIVAALGETAFLPTSKMKRAPSKASSIGRSASFLRHQKENARNEISELVETEESYVTRLHELCQISSSIGKDLNESHRLRLRQVFPTGIGSIAEANEGLLSALRAIVSSTEGSAQHDIQTSSDDHPTALQIRQDLRADNQGIDAVAKCLCAWLPKFKDCYASYMKQHSEAALLLRNLMHSNEAAMHSVIQDIGEQKLTSLLIEPVQRLPRYSLYIDGISKQLPVRHPALKHLLKARDIVSDICNQDDADSAANNMVERLRARVVGWPSDTVIHGRLVTAVDYTELAPPYDLEKSVVHLGMLLLFSDTVVWLERRGDHAISARTLLTELEAPALPKQKQDDLLFIRKVPLHAVECAESHEGQTVTMTTFELTDSASATKRGLANSHLVLLLEGSYEGKASRLLEDITKARIEGRFSEAERESSKWEARATDSSPDQLRLFSAVFEDSVTEYISSRKDFASIRVIVEIDRHAQKYRAGQNGIRTVVTISLVRSGICRLSVDSIDGAGGSEHLPLADLMAVLRRKLTSLIAARFAITRPALTAMLIGRNSDILQSLELQAADDSEPAAANLPLHSPKRQRSNNLRPLSPVKMLSSLLSSSGPGSHPPPLLKKDSGSSIPTLGAPPAMAPPPRPTTSSSKPPSREGRPASTEQATVSSLGSDESRPGPIDRLEDTMSAYILALKARKGNIVGRSLKMRATADELAVNELYNTLLENHQMMVTAAQAPVDVLFAAFEKFLNVAWKEQIGQVMPYHLLQEIQSKAESMLPKNFDEYFRSALCTVAPQNQRAFKAIVNLLHDLLDGTGNDGDRGALTAAFAELLVSEGNPHDFIALIDKFVDDVDTYFGAPLPEPQNHADDSAASHKRSRSANTGSLTSNTSSLRRKFGFGSLSRENSKSEQESMVGSVWRTLSKTRTGESSPASSISRGTLQRAHSTDLDGRVQTRPCSQDGPLGRKGSATDETGPLTASSSTQQLGLTTIGEHPSFIPTGPPRKKRRSSLSDLKALGSPFGTPQRLPRPAFQKGLVDKSLPASPIPSTPSSKGGSIRIGSPTRENLRPPLPASFRSENSLSPGRAPDQAPLRPKSLHGSPAAAEDMVTITATSAETKVRPLSSIPTLTPRALSPTKISSPVTPVRNGLSERSDAGNIVRKPPSPQQDKTNYASPAAKAASPTKKLRMQSPQKLRERLQTEQAAIEAAHSSLQDELGKIGDELSSTPGRLAPPRVGGARGSMQRPNASAGTGVDVAAKVLKLEGSLPQQMASLTSKLESIQSDVSSSLAVSENKCKKLDALYREANAENEALYSRFNDELARVMKSVRGGEGVEELKRRLKEQEEEVGRLRRDNGRLKREVVGLRAQLKE